jgi:hypothetical protein
VSRLNAGAAPAGTGRCAPGETVVSDPKTDREASPVRSLLLGVAAVIILVIAGGGYVLYQRIGVLDVKVRTLQASMNDLKARVERI